MNLLTDIADARWSELGDIESWVCASCDAVLGADDPRTISLLFTDDADMQHLNKTWRGKDKPTNVLSFPAVSNVANSDVRPLGDIVLAYETVVREATEADKPVAHHVQHLLVHGVLHLLGYDHEDDLQAQAMEDRERDTLRQLGIPDPYHA
jgi:probable rRNA maturation factor